MRYALLALGVFVLACSGESTGPTPDFFTRTVDSPQFWWECLGMECNFQTTDKSLPALWDLGDGSTSTQQEIRHTYADAGIYTTTLTQAQSSSLTFPLPNAEPVPSYSVVCSKSRECKFTSTTTDDHGLEEELFHFYYCFSWGCQTAAAQGLSPVTRKLKPGTYRVRLDVRDTHGIERMVQADFVVGK